MVLVAYITMCLIFGTTFLAIKIGLEAGWIPYFSAGFRFFAAGLLVVVYGFVTKQFPVPTKKHIIQFLVTGTCMTGITFGTLYWAEQYIPSSFAALLSATGPLFVALMHSKVEKVKITKVQFLGLGLGFLGIIFLTWPSISVQFDILWFIACLVIVIGESFYAFGTIYSKIVLKQGISALMLNGYQMLFGGLLLLLASFIVEKPNISHVNQTGWLSLLYLIVIGSILGHGLYYWLIQKTNPAFPSTWLYVSPFISLVLDIWIQKETFHPLSILGGIIILAGVYLMNGQAVRHAFLKRQKSVAS
jgi:drug/metabolite transporter (DMT)-like permease